MEPMVPPMVCGQEKINIVVNRNAYIKIKDTEGLSSPSSMHTIRFRFSVTRLIILHILKRRLVICNKTHNIIIACILVKPANTKVIISTY